MHIIFLTRVAKGKKSLIIKKHTLQAYTSSCACHILHIAHQHQNQLKESGKLTYIYTAGGYYVIYKDPHQPSHHHQQPTTMLCQCSDPGANQQRGTTDQVTATIPNYITKKSISDMIHYGTLNMNTETP